jgi:putative tryptophan/tyrosine transport system substrate-binding protein
MKKAALLSILVVVVLLAVDVMAYAQQPTKVPRIGFLTLNSSSTFSACDEAFRQGLISVGYIEGKNIVIEWRSAEGKLDRLPALAAELLRLKIDIIVTAGEPATRAAKDATVTILLDVFPTTFLTKAGSLT